MRLQFDAFSGDDDDDDAFRDAKDMLLEQFDRWRDERGERDDGTIVGNASMFLDWRYSYSTGVLDEYRDSDIAEFLLEWCPRKYSAPAEEAFAVCRSVGQFVEFLARTDRLVGGADRAARLITLAEELAPDVHRAMGDPSNFGMAKSMFGGSLAGLADFEGPDEVQRFLDQKMAEFNALPFEQRKALTDRHFLPPEPEPIELPFVHIPPPAADVAAAAESAPIIVKINALRSYLGDEGKPLTDKGHLKLADGRALVELLDTGDRFDEAIGNRTFKTRSTDELRQLRLIVDLAKKAGAVRVHRRRLVPLRAWAGRDPVDRAVATVRAAADEGPLGMIFRGNRYGFDAIGDVVDDGLVHWLTMLLPPGIEVPYDDVAAVTRTAVLEVVRPRPPYWTEDSIGGSAGRDLARTVEVMELVNVVTWNDRIETTDRFGIVERRGGRLKLTALGRHAVPDLATEVGYHIHSIGDLADAEADELLDVIDQVTDDDLEALVASWQPALDPGQRAERVADVVARVENPRCRLAGLAVFDVLGTEASEPYVRQLLDSRASGHAASWLLAHGLADDDTVGRFVGIGVLVDVLASCDDDPEQMCEMFLESPTVKDAEHALEQMWRHDAPETATVLDVLGRHLTDRRLAKAARKALFRHRSWTANRP